MKRVILVSALVASMASCTINTQLTTSLPRDVAMGIEEEPVKFEYSVSSNVMQEFALKGGYTVNTNHNYAFREKMGNYFLHKSSCLQDCESMDVNVLLERIKLSVEDRTSGGQKAALILAGTGTTQTEYITAAEGLFTIEYKGQTFNKPFRVTTNQNREVNQSSAYGYTSYNSNGSPAQMAGSVLNRAHEDIIIQLDKFIDSVLSLEKK